MPQPGRPLIAKIICSLSQVLAVSRLPPPPPPPRPLHQASASFDRSKVTPSYYPSSHNARITLIVSIRDSIRYYRGSWNVCSNIRVFEFYLYVVLYKVKSNNQLINRLIDVSFQKYMMLKLFVHRTFFFSSI